MNPSTGTRKENMAIVIVSSYSTVVEPLTSDHEAEGFKSRLLLAPGEEMVEKSFERK